MLIIGSKYNCLSLLHDSELECVKLQGKIHKRPINQLKIILTSHFNFIKAEFPLKGN
jgi:hypothetical protein